MQNLEPFRQALVKLAAPRIGDRVLDVATGPGEPALTIAQLVGPSGKVVGVDLSEKMIEIAEKTAALRHMRNVEFKVMNAEKLDIRDDAFDLAVSAFGFQIITEPDKAARETFRVLKNGGRIATTVWGPGERVPAIHAIIGPMLEHAEPDETGYLPTPYEMGGHGELAEFLSGAGFRDTKEERVTYSWRFRDEDDYLEQVLKGTPIGHSLSEEEKNVQDEVVRKTRENLVRWRSPRGLEIPAECVVVTARK
ncbi:MAG: class I SAM-dependent methyltransferase [Methanobacteriota archaeon]